MAKNMLVRAKISKVNTRFLTGIDGQPVTPCSFSPKTQICIVTRHENGISSLVSKTSVREETRGGVANWNVGFFLTLQLECCKVSDGYRMFFFVVEPPKVENIYDWPGKRWLHKITHAELISAFGLSSLPVMISWLCCDCHVISRITCSVKLLQQDATERTLRRRGCGTN